MIATSFPLLAVAGDAATATAKGVTRTTFEWGRIQQNSDWILPIAVVVALLFFIRYMYRRDAVELPRLVSWLLTFLRAATILALLVLYLQPQWRTEQERTINSRALLLVDTSLSMGLTDAPATTDGGTSSRVQQVSTMLGQTELIDQLRKVHDVSVYQFNESLDHDRVQTLLKREQREDGTTDDVENGSNDEDTQNATSAADINWSEFLAPGGASTQIGSALRQLINDESNSPVSGIIVFSDGGQNAGVAPEAAVELARRANIPLFTVGIGSDQKPSNVRVSDLVAPARAYPGDDYVVTGYVQAQQMAGKVVEVQLLSREAQPGTSGEPGTGQIEQSQQITLGDDGEVIPVKFELTPDETGRRTLCFRINAPAGDGNPSDNLREVDIDIIDRKSRVLLFAGGPMRDYRFLRSLLFRDKATTLDIYLQTAQPGISQEADTLLDDFPATREEMFQYDCVIAFDPDWQKLSGAQLSLLENWVAEQGGGLILVAGHVYTGQAIAGWIEDEAMATVRALYPVEFYRRFSTVNADMYTTDEPWPLDFTREGFEAEYLWLEDTASAAREAWASFEGVYSFCPVRGPKPAASVLARFSDPRTGEGDSAPVFFAEQFYGSGRVFYIGSGEMWRLRKHDPAYFERFYTKLVRHVSQGRLLRGSSRGVLLVGQDRYLLGSTVEIRAQLTNARLEPLADPSVDLQVILPNSSVQTVRLQPDPAREGTYVGRFQVLDEGSYRLELAIPESEDERLTRRLQVRVPDLERENPQRNDAVLSRLAVATGGKYFVGLNELLTGAELPIVKMLKDRTKTIILTAPPDKLWEQTWLKWMMLTLCGLLCLEWLIRRLLKLA